MTKMTDKQIEQSFRDAPRLDPSGQPRSNSGIADQAGGSPVATGRPAGRDGGPGVPASGGTAERLGGWGDRQIPAAELPKDPPPVTTGRGDRPPKGR